MTFVCYEACYTTSTEGTIHGIIWKNQQSQSVFLHDAKNHKYWIVWTDRLGTLQKHHQKTAIFYNILAFSDVKQSTKSHPIICLEFYSGMIQTCCMYMTNTGDGVKLTSTLSPQPLKDHTCMVVLQLTEKLPGDLGMMYSYSMMQKLTQILAFCSYAHFC